MNWMLYTYSRLFVKKIKRQSSKIPKSDFVTAVDSGAAAILCPTSRTTIRRHVFKRPPRALLLLRLAANFIMQSCWGKSLLRKKVCCQSCQTYHCKKGNLKSLEVVKVAFYRVWCGEKTIYFFPGKIRIIKFKNSIPSKFEFRKNNVPSKLAL